MFNFKYFLNYFCNIIANYCKVLTFSVLRDKVFLLIVWLILGAGRVAPLLITSI